MGALHIYKGASGQATPYASSGLVLEDNVPTYLEFLSPSTQAASGVLWGDEAGTTIGSVLYDHTSNYMRFTIAGTEKVRITTDGNVGIGTTGPGEKLEVAGNLLVSGGNELKFSAPSGAYAIHGISFGLPDLIRISKIDGNECKHGNVGIDDGPNYKLVSCCLILLRSVPPDGQWD